MVNYNLIEYLIEEIRENEWKNVIELFKFLENKYNTNLFLAHTKAQISNVVGAFEVQKSLEIILIIIAFWKY